MRCEVAVIGAGPAGSLAAATLAQRGMDVMLIDGSHPREKPCGGGYTGRALALLEPLVPGCSGFGNRVCRAAFLDTTRGREVSVDLILQSNTLVVAGRALMDAALFDAAGRSGARVVRRRVAGITPGRPHLITMAGGEQVATPFIVGADGANSLVRRTFARAFQRHQLSIATGFFARDVTSDAITLELVDDPSGYIWSFPRPDHLAIGICAQADGVTVGAARERLLHWMAQTAITRGAQLEPYSWPIPSLPASDFATVEFGGDGWLTVGDAAGLVDPITREGIYFALQSALMAADALTGGARSAPQTYSRQVRTDIASELAIAARLKAGFFQPRFTRLMLDALGSSARIRDVMADLVAGTQPYSTLKRRLLGTFELGLAWNWWRSSQRTA